jgi:hypothetical protein
MALPHHYAELVLDELGVTGFEDLKLLELIAWERGAMVQYKPLEGAEARLAIVGRKAIISVSSYIQTSRRGRFSIAHELGHLEMHRQNGIMLCVDKDIDNWGGKDTSTDLEHEANEFAAALLLPKRFFALLCKSKEPSLGLIADLADTFDVSLTATALRYLRFCDEACAVVFSQDGHIKWFRGSEDFENFGAFINVRSKLDPSSIAAAFFQSHTIRDVPKRVGVSTWFEPGRYRGDASILEQSWVMPNYNAVLTLLWVDEDIEEDKDFLW